MQIKSGSDDSPLYLQPFYFNLDLVRQGKACEKEDKLNNMDLHEDLRQGILSWNSRGVRAWDEVVARTLHTFPHTSQEVRRQGEACEFASGKLSEGMMMLCESLKLKGLKLLDQTYLLCYSKGFCHLLEIWFGLIMWVVSPVMLVLDFQRTPTQSISSDHGKKWRGLEYLPPGIMTFAVKLSIWGHWYITWIQCHWNSHKRVKKFLKLWSARLKLVF